MIIVLILVVIGIGSVIGYFNQQRKAKHLAEVIPTIQFIPVKIIATRKFGVNGFITFEDAEKNRFEILARSGIAPISTYQVGDTGRLKHVQNELVEFVRDKEAT